MKSFVAGAILGVSALAAQAEEVTFEYTGVFNFSEPTLSLGHTTLSQGETVRGTFTLDLSATERYYVDEWGIYYIPGDYIDGTTRATTEFDRAGYQTEVAWTDNVKVTNGATDTLWIDIPGTARKDGLEALTFSFKDEQGTALDSLAQPRTLNLADWELATVSYYFGVYGGPAVYGATATLTSLRVLPTTPVPEPASFALLSMGLLTLGGVAYRRRRSE